MPTRTDWLSVLLQNSDSLFPTGAYAHSSGLEEMVRLGVVSNEATLRDFLREQMLPNLEHVELPYVRFVYEAALRNEMTELASLSEEIHAWKLAHETREASLQMGQGRLQAARKVFPHPLLDELARSLMPKHLILTYGVQMAAACVPLESALAGYFYQTVAGICSASLKLIRIGQEGVQRALRESLLETETVVTSSQLVVREEAGWFGPLLEIAAMRHERAEERLFIS